MRKPIPFGKYLLLDRINVGGMAEVFLAKSFGVEGFERLLAIKKILPTMVEDQEFITMFIDEARIAVQLNHANIVQIYELGKHDENYFIAMEYVSGRDLRTILDKFKRRGELMPLAQAVYIAQKMCEGLDYAHRKKDARGQEMHIVHRDVSPQNILLSFDGEVKLIDFGIAKAANRSQKTQAGILKGKFGYMSPEQVRGLPIDGRSDIFAVGVCLYEMVTGEKLFVGESDFSTLEKVRNAEVPRPSTFKPDLPQGLEDVLMKALARDVEDRYQHASDMQEDLLRFLLTDGTLFAAKHLSAFMHQEFTAELEREAERLESFAGVAPPPEVAEAAATASPPPEPVPDPAEALGPPPEEMLQKSGDATVLFDAGEAFGGAQPAPIGDEETTDHSDEGAVTPGPEVAEDADTDEGQLSKGPPKHGPLGDPEAAAHQDAVGRFAEEIPSSPGTVGPDGALLDQATRITHAEEVLKPPPPKVSPHIREVRPPSPPKVSVSPSATALPDVRPSQVRSAAKPPAGGRQNRVRLYVAGGVGVVLAILAAVGVARVIRGPAPTTGSLAILTVPDQHVEILVDGQLVDHASPVFIRSLDAGEHQVVVRSTRDGAQAAKAVDVPAGGQAHVTVRLPGAAAPPTTAAPPAATPPAPAEPTPAPVAKAAAPTPAPKPAPTPAPAPTHPKALAAGTPPAKPAPPKPAPPPMPTTGTAILTSEPSGAEVRVGRKVVGRTPYHAKGLDLDGVHRFTLAKHGYHSKEIRVAFAGKTTQTVDTRLEALPPPAPVHRPRRAVRHRAVRHPAARPHGQGTLIAQCIPWAKVLVDGHDTGRVTPITPASPLKLPVGHHTVTFQAAGGKSKTFSVQITKGKMQRVIYRF